MATNQPSWMTNTADQPPEIQAALERERAKAGVQAQHAANQQRRDAAHNDPLKAVDYYYPEYQSMFQDGGGLQDQYKVNAGGDIQFGTGIDAGQLDTAKHSADRGALGFMRDRAMAEGDSPWAKLQLQKQMAQEGNLQGLAAMQGRGQTTQALGDLAMRGGLSSGASERMARQGAQNQRAGYQDIARSGMDQRFDIRSTDEQQKMGLLQQVPGLDLRFADQGAGLDRFNIGQQTDVDKFNRLGLMDAAKFNSSKDLTAQMANQRAAVGGAAGLNNFNINRYGETMKAVSANALSNALGGGGGGGGGGPGQQHPKGRAQKVAHGIAENTRSDRRGLDAGGWTKLENYNPDNWDVRLG